MKIFTRKIELFVWIAIIKGKEKTNLVQNEITI